MAKIAGSIDIEASPETVWRILMDRENEFKFYPNLVSHEIDPPGMAVLGQKSHAIGRIGGIKIETFTEIAELEPNKKLTFSGKPGGMLKSFTQAITVEPTPTGTSVTQTGEIEVSMGPLGEVLRRLFIDRIVMRNLEVFLRSLKELAEAV